jgi:hypothetical protein
MLRLSLIRLLRYSSIWDASEVNGGAWVGTASYSDAPYYFQIKGASAS